MDSNPFPETVVYQPDTSEDEQQFSPYRDDPDASGEDPFSPYTDHHYWCSQCDVTFSSEEDRRRHQREAEHHYLCRHPDCQAYLFNFADIVYHYRIHHQNIHCKVCDKLFKDSVQWEWHTTNLHIFCRRCKLVFSTEEERTEHYKTAKEHKKTYCDYCGYDATNPIDFLCHRLNHSMPKGGWEHKYHPREGRSKPRSFFEEDPIPPAPPNHYDVLGVDMTITHEELVKAAKEKRIRTHPDKFSKCELSKDEMAKVTANSQDVGLAADILTDPAKRAQYDFDVRMWRTLHGKK